MSDVKITFRGWAGHFCASHKCLFKLNTLLEYEKKKIVVSTVGLYLLTMNYDGDEQRFETLDIDGNYFETRAFWAYTKSKFNDINVKMPIYFDTDLPRYKKPDMELKANEGHYKVIEELSTKLKNGEL
jgi:hypothetical protein